MQSPSIKHITWNSPALGGDLGTQAKYVKIEPGEFNGIRGFWLYPKAGDPAFKPGSEVAQIRFEAAPDVAPDQPEPAQPEPVAPPMAPPAAEPSAQPIVRKRGRPPKVPRV